MAVKNMQLEYKFPSMEDAKRAAGLLPIACRRDIVTDRTDNAYLRIDEEYGDYFERYIWKKRTK